MMLNYLRRETRYYINASAKNNSQFMKLATQQFSYGALFKLSETMIFSVVKHIILIIRNLALAYLEWS